MLYRCVSLFFFFFQAEDGIRDKLVTGVQTCALPICRRGPGGRHGGGAYRCRRRCRTDARRPSACTDGGTGRARGLPHLTSGFLMSPPPAPVTAGKIMDKLVSLAKRRGFVFQSSEIYGGLGSVWDYGPLGVELKKNIKDRWWRSMVHAREDIEGLDAAIPI